MKPSNERNFIILGATALTAAAIVGIARGDLPHYDNDLQTICTGSEKPAVLTTNARERTSPVISNDDIEGTISQGQELCVDDVVNGDNPVTFDPRTADYVAGTGKWIKVATKDGKTAYFNMENVAQ